MVDAERVHKRPRPASTGAGTLPTLITAAALAVAVIGVVMALDQLAGARQAPATTDTLGGLTVQVSTSGWLTDEHHGNMPMAGYQMPGQMMPGMPEGDDIRLSIPITLRNTSEASRRFTVEEEFRLVGGHEGARPVVTDTFGGLTRLNPDTSVNGILYFDVGDPAATDPPFRLEWTRAGDTVVLAIPAADAPPPTRHH